MIAAVEHRILGVRIKDRPGGIESIPASIALAERPAMRRQLLSGVVRGLASPTRVQVSIFQDSPTIREDFPAELLSANRPATLHGQGDFIRERSRNKKGRSGALPPLVTE